MKNKIKLLMLILMVFPLVTLADNPEDWYTVDDAFEAGERLKVRLNDEGLRGEFFSIEASPAGEEYVWMIYNGNVCDPNEDEGGVDSFKYCNDVFAEVDDGEATNAWEGSKAERILERAMNNPLAKWEYAEEYRLLQQKDLDYFKDDNGNKLIKPNNDGVLEIPAELWFLGAWYFPVSDAIIESTYWTMIPEGDNKVMAVEFNEGWGLDSEDPVSFVKPYHVEGEIVGEEEEKIGNFVIRPVVKVHKTNIDCSDDLDRVATTTPKNPQTSENAVPYIIISLGILSTVLYFNVQSNNKFKKY